MLCAVVIHRPAPPAPAEHTEKHVWRMGHGGCWRVCCSCPQCSGTREILWRPVIVVIVSLPCVTIHVGGNHVGNIDIIILCSHLCGWGSLSGIAYDHRVLRFPEILSLRQWLNNHVSSHRPSKVISCTALRIYRKFHTNTDQPSALISPGPPILLISDTSLSVAIYT